MFDVASIIADHQRTLGRRETDEGEAYVLRLSRHYDAAVEDVWEACTDPGRIGRWFLPITGDLRLGGSYQLEGNAGGRIKGCEPPRRLAVTWELGGGTSDLTLTLSPGADGARTSSSSTSPCGPSPKSSTWTESAAWRRAGRTR
jgi:uncharacterized protein YndB with AHSA1/START domain